MQAVADTHQVAQEVLDGDVAQPWGQGALLDLVLGGAEDVQEVGVEGVVPLG